MSTGSAGRLATLASYVPQRILRDVAGHTGRPAAALADRTLGVLLLIDISGFTALTTAAVERGPAGIEGLSRALNAQLGVIIELIAEHGGDIDKFVGDAILAVWRVEDGSLEAVAAQAAACGLAIVARLGEVALDGDTHLPLKVGLCSGEIATMHVGGVGDRWLHVVAGGGVAQLAGLAQHMRSGALIAAPGAWAMVADAFSGEPRGEGHVQVGQARRPIIPTSLTAVDLGADDEARLRAYVPQVCLARLDAGQADWLAELRRTTVVFVNVHGLADATADVTERLQAVTRVAQEVLDRLDGWLKEITVDEKGTTLVAAFGVPPFSHEDDPDRAMRAALRIQAEIAALGLTPGVGVATGPAFCGPVGNARRRDFVVLGGHVNLAARLMQASGPDVVLADSDTRTGAHGQELYQQLPPFVLKGMAAPVDVYRVRPAPSEPGRSLGLVDRVAERAAAADAIEALLAGRGGFVVLEGEPGIGKSRLIEAWLSLAAAAGTRALVGAAAEIEASTPYHAWRAIFERLLGVSGLTDRAARRALVMERLRADETSLRLAPLLETVLPLDLVDDDVTSQLSGAVRADNTRDLLVAILRREATAGPLMIVLEDAHWLDSVSWSLVVRARREIPNLLLVVTMRPVGDAAPEPFAAIRDEATTLHIESLSSEDALALACERTGAVKIAEPVAALVLERAEGNPLFIEQLTFAMRDAGRIVVEDGLVRTAAGDGRLDGALIPDTVQRVITTRLDQLPPGESMTLKVASVVGQQFTLRTLVDIYPIATDAATLASHLDMLTRLDLVAPVPDGAEPTFAFRHVITQEVAYNVMLPAQSKQLHRSLAEWYERTYADDLSPYHAFLAHHWRQAGQPAQAVEQLALAGAQALRTFANEEAVAFFAGALALADEAALTIGPERRAHWELQLGEAFVNLSRYRDGRPHLDAGLRLMGQATPSTAVRQSVALIGELLRQVGRRLGLVRGTRSLSPAGQDDLVAVLRALGSLTEASYYANETLLPLYCVIRVLNEAEASGIDAEIARGLSGTGALFGVVPLPRIAEWYLQRAQERLLHVDDLTTKEIVGIVIGFYYLGAAGWDVARDSFEAVRGIALDLRDRRRLDDAVGNLMELELLHGRPDVAAELASQLVDAANERNDQRYAAEGLIGRAYAALRLGDEPTLTRSMDALGAILDAEIELTDEIRLKRDGLEALIHLGRDVAPEALLSAAAAMSRTAGQRPTSFGTFLGYVAPAEVYTRLSESSRGIDVPVATRAEAVSRLRAFAGVFPIGRPRYATVHGREQWLLGHRDAALRSWREAIARADELAMPYEAGVAHHEIGRHLTADDPERAHHLQAARDIFTSLEASRPLARVEADAAGDGDVDHG